MSAGRTPFDLLRPPGSPPRVAAPTGLPTKVEIDEWTGAINDLFSAAAEYRRCAKSLDAIADAHCQTLSAPGGTDWEGSGADAAREAAYADRGVVWQATDHIRHNLAKAAEDGAQAVSAARNRVIEAIDQAEQDGFTVGDDLSVADTNTYTDMSVYQARQAKAAEHSQDIAKLAGELVAADTHAGRQLSTEAAALDAMVPTSWGPRRQESDDRPTSDIEAVDHERGEPALESDPAPAGQAGNPPNGFVGDQRFGHWEPVVPPPYVGATPPPLKPEYRPFPEDPTKLGGTTGMYTPGRTWVQDSSAPYVQRQEEYRFRIAGQEATTYTRMVNENGVWKQERWVQNVYEYQRNTQLVFGGDISRNGEKGSLAGLPPMPNFDNEWKRILPQEIAVLSAQNPTIKYYLPDGCGGQFTFENGVPVGGYSGLPPASMTPIPGTGQVPPVMTRPW
ncbi:hypothetical protein [Mycobacterium hubeiense]|uniref:hypothetical protein n=1 Tax=Mycobacterium hubeiense TaxID=1867256 RepID=UPI00115BAAB1|nr:hypothetical protein [Mycobacterium sp. QGD 101]